MASDWAVFAADNWNNRGEKYSFQWEEGLIQVNE